jgi:hypothetical protein
MRISKVVLLFSLRLVIVAATLFITAGSLRFWQGWTFTALFFIAAIPSLL